jgi:DNA-binding transcriptional ArsR family regulator
MDIKVPYVIQDLWKKYGFQANPFDTSPLSLADKSLLPIAEAIVGRDFETQESRTLRNVLRNPGGARVVVEGNVGVGKTTFVNYHRYLWEHYSQSPLLTPQEEIAVTEEWRLPHLLMNILASLISKLVIVKGEENICQVPVFKEILALCRVLFQTSLGVEGSLFGFGAGFSRSSQVNIPVISEIQLLRYFKDMVKAIKQIGYAGVFLHLDNLEILNRQDISRTRSFFDDIRDTLQVPDVYFVFVGNGGFFRDIITPLPRVRSIFFGRPVTIPALTKEQVIAATQKRYHLLALRKGQFIKPVEDSLIEYLYDVYAGNLRYIMDAMNMLVPEICDQYVQTIPSENARICLSRLIAEQIQAALTFGECEIFHFCLRAVSFTNKSLSQQFGITTSNIARVMNRLRELNLIYLERKEGKKLYYRVSEYAQMAQNHLQLTWNFTPPTAPTVPKTAPIAEARLSKVAKRFLQAISFIRKKGKIKHQEYTQIFRVSLATATRDLNQLVMSGKLCHKGVGKNAYYEVADTEMVAE